MHKKDSRPEAELGIVHVFDTTVEAVRFKGNGIVKPSVTYGIMVCGLDEEKRHAHICIAFAAHELADLISRLMQVVENVDKLEQREQCERN